VQVGYEGVGLGMVRIKLNLNGTELNPKRSLGGSKQKQNYSNENGLKQPKKLFSLPKIYSNKLN
jgi:hypothetical protein